MAATRIFASSEHITAHAVRGLQAARDGALHARMDGMICEERSPLQPRHVADGGGLARSSPYGLFLGWIIACLSIPFAIL